MKKLTIKELKSRLENVNKALQSYYIKNDNYGIPWLDLYVDETTLDYDVPENKMVDYFGKNKRLVPIYKIPINHFNDETKTFLAGQEAILRSLGFNKSLFKDNSSLEDYEQDFDELSQFNENDKPDAYCFFL